MFKTRMQLNLDLTVQLSLLNIETLQKYDNIKAGCITCFKHCTHSISTIMKNVVILRDFVKQTFKFLKDIKFQLKFEVLL